MKNWLYRWLPIIFGCHCRDERSFHFRGEKFPICARCTGELVGLLFSLFSCFFFRLPIGISILLMLPMTVDGFLQLKTAYESNNRRRFFTGFLFGYSLFMLFLATTIMAIQFGISLSIKYLQ